MYKKPISLFVALCIPIFAHANISEVVCGSWEGVIKSQTFTFREAGIPIDTAQEAFNSEDSASTRIFLRRVVRAIYTEPQKGRQYVNSGQFLRDCVKVHRGY